jgi:micrococcal nuclease
MYQYKAKFNKVIDGDTINLTIDLGFRMTMTTNCRLAGINAPEKNDVHRWGISMLHLAKLIKETPGELTIISRSLDKYGRPIVAVYIGEQLINQQMVSDGMADKYNG